MSKWAQIIEIMEETSFLSDKSRLALEIIRRGIT